MPITFEAPQPTGTGIAQSYGAGVQGMQDVPALTSLYAQTAHLQQQGLLAGRAAAQQSNEATTRAQLADRGMDLQAQQHADQTALGYAALQQHQADMQTHAEVQAWLSQQQMSQADMNRMQQQQQAVTDTETAYRNGTIDLPTRNAAIMKLKTGIDMDRQRYERQQAAHLDKQNQMLDTQMQQMAAHEAAYEQFRVEAAARGQTVAMIPDGKGGIHGPFAFNRNTGELYRPGVAGGEAAQAKEEAKQQAAAYKAEIDAGKQWDTAYEKAKAHIRSLAKETVKTADGRTVPKTPELSDPDYFEGRVKSEMNPDYGPDRGAYVKKQIARFQKPAAAGGSTGAGGDFSQPQPGDSQPAPPPAAQKFAADNPPFDLQKPTTDNQKAAVEQWNAMGKAAERFTQDQAQLQGYRQSAAWAVRALAAYGSVVKMPPDVQKQYLGIKAAMAPFLSPPKAAARAAPADLGPAPPLGVGGY